MSEKNNFDFSGKKISEVKNEVRQILTEELKQYLSERYEKVRLVSTNEIAVLVGNRNDEDGFSHDVVSTIKITCKPFYDSVGEKGRQTVQYDIDEEASNYSFEAEQKEIKRLKREEKKKKKEAEKETT